MGVDGKTYTYTYNADGLRVTKTVDGVVHTYYYDGTELLMEKWGNCYLRFTYNEQGRPFSVDYYNGTALETFYYVLNLQGDVIEIRNSINNVVCRYSYDAWGKILSVKDGSGIAIAAAGHIGNLNPLRYRGYYYDSETGLYYLRSRYYDPVVCRFVNADGSLNQQDGMIGFNMFAYCINNPVNGSDPCGTCFHRWMFWKDCAKCAASKAKKKALEAAQTIKYDVPLYKQGKLLLCWAFCQTMMESYNSGTILTQKEAKKRAIEIAQDYHGSTNKKVWNQGGWPSNLGKRIGRIGGIEELYKIHYKKMALFMLIIIMKIVTVRT